MADIYEPLRTKTCNISNSWMGLEPNLPKHEQPAEGFHKKACMKLYKATKPLYLETDALEIVLGAALLQLLDGMNCTYEEVPEAS